jgi:arylsulfatase A-like enzyme
MSNETILANQQRISHLYLILLGISGGIIFAGIEGIFCLFFSGKYWQYYILSIALWAIIGIIYYFPFLGICFLLRKIFTRFTFKKFTFNEYRLMLTFLAMAPLFLYTAVQLNLHLPGKFSSKFSLGMDALLLLIFAFASLFLYGAWKKQDKQLIVKNYFLSVFLMGCISISGVFLVVSELQVEQRVMSVYLVFIFCALLPILSIYILKKLNFGMLRKSLIIIGIICILLIIELKVICPIRDYFVFERSAPDTSQKTITPLNSPNILLIVMDTARAANFSLYGYKRCTTPNLEQFAGESVLFKNAISSAPWTLPSHASLFTGFISYVHGATHGKTKDVHALMLHENFDTLAEILTSHGYKTAGVTANTAWLSPSTELDQGFNYYWWGKSRDSVLFLPTISMVFLGPKSNSYLKRICGVTTINSAKRINNIAINWLRKHKDQPWFLFINYMEAHGIEYLPSPYSKLFTKPPKPAFSLNPEDSIVISASNGKLERLRSWYDNQLAFLDSQIALFFESLKDMGLFEETIIVVTSDHGELLGEHEDIGHEFWLYHELLHVPLIIKYPFKKHSGSIIHKIVQNIDIFAELLHQAGISIPANIQGQPFSEVTHPIISEVERCPIGAVVRPDRYDRDLKALYSKQIAGFKLIKSSDERRELYHIENDPTESNNILDFQKIEIIEKELNKYLASLQKLRAIEQTYKHKKLDGATIERLRALGYLQ